MRTLDARRGAQEQPMLVDSGRNGDEIHGDEIHVVALRGDEDGVAAGLIRGDLPDKFVWRGSIYRRSSFVQRDAAGGLLHSYYRNTTRAQVPTADRSRDLRHGPRG